MRTKLAIPVLLGVALLAGGAVLADAMADVAVQYDGSAVSVRNGGEMAVTAKVMRMCATGDVPIRMRPPSIRYFKVTVVPGSSVRIDRDRSESCSYSIAAAHYAR